MVNVTLRPLYPPVKTPFPLYRRLGGPQGPYGRVWKISPPTGIRSPDRPARRESLYRLSLRGPHYLAEYMCKRGLQSSWTRCYVVWCTVWRCRGTATCRPDCTASHQGVGAVATTVVTAVGTASFTWVNDRM